MAITLKKKLFLTNLRKCILDSHMKNVLPKLQSCRLNDVAIINRTDIHAYTHIYKHPAEKIMLIGNDENIILLTIVLLNQ